MLLQAFNTVRPYYDYACSIEGIIGSTQLQWVIRDIILRTIEVMWNLPSSKNHHHSQEWGGLIHSLETACRQAEIMAGQKVITDHGVNSHRSKRDVKWMALSGFLEGMLHDCSKLNDVEILGKGDPKKAYNPIKGQLLDFYLVHGGDVRVSWKSKRDNTKVFWNYAFVFGFVPFKILQEMPHDIFFGLILRLGQEEALAADRASVRAWSMKKIGNQSLHRAVGSLFQKDPTSYEPKALDNFFCEKITQDWYICHSKNFLYQLAVEEKTNSKDYLEYLKSTGLIASNGTLHFAKLTLVKDSKTHALPVIFLRSQVIDEPLENTHGFARENTPISNAKIASKDKNKVLKLFGDTTPALPAELFLNSEDKHPPQKPKSKKTPKTDFSKVSAEPKSTPEEHVDPEDNVEAPPISLEGLFPSFADEVPIEPERLSRNKIPADEYPEAEMEEECEHSTLPSTPSAAHLHFYEKTSLTTEEAVAQFCGFLNRMKTRRIQPAEKGLCWISVDGQVCLSYPSAIHAAMDISANSIDLSKDMKDLRSKFLSLLHQERLLLSAEFQKGSFEYYIEPETLQKASYSGSYLEVGFEALRGKAPSFAEKIDQHLSVLTAAALLNDEEIVEAS